MSRAAPLLIVVGLLGAALTAALLFVPINTDSEECGNAITHDGKVFVTRTATTSDQLTNNTACDPAALHRRLLAVGVGVLTIVSGVTAAVDPFGEYDDDDADSEDDDNEDTSA